MSAWLYVPLLTIGAGVICALAGRYATLGGKRVERMLDDEYDNGRAAGARELYAAAQQHVVELGADRVLILPDGMTPIGDPADPRFWYPENEHMLRDCLRQIERAKQADFALQPDTWLRDQLNDLHAWAERERDKSRRWATRTGRSAPRVTRELEQAPLLELEAVAS